MKRSSVFGSQSITVRRSNLSVFSTTDYLISIKLPFALTKDMLLTIETSVTNSPQVSQNGQITIPALASPVPKIASNVQLKDPQPALLRAPAESPESQAKTPIFPVFKKNNDSLIVSNFKVSNFQINATSDVTFQIKFLTENLLSNERIVLRFFADIFPSNQGTLTSPGRLSRRRLLVPAFRAKLVFGLWPLRRQ